MLSRLRTLGVVITAIGIIAVMGGVFGLIQIQRGGASLQGFSEAQGVELTYNDEGNLVDRGSEEQAQAIKELLTESWHWPAVESELDSNDPLIDTGTEYMYQMATIAYHVLHGSQSVTLEERAEYDGDGDRSISAEATIYSPETLPDGVWDPAVEGTSQDAIFEPGTYDVPINVRYWTEFNRSHPLDGVAREQAWSGTVHGLFAQLGVGATTAKVLQLGAAVMQIAIAFGLAFLVTGAGLYWVGKAEDKPLRT